MTETEYNLHPTDLNEDGTPALLASSLVSIGNGQMWMSATKYNDGPPMDTRIQFTEDSICHIPWSQKDEFIGELRALIAKYAI